MKILETPEWLLEHLNDEDLIISDASLERTVGTQESTDGSKRKFIPNSRILSVEQDFRDRTSTLPHMLPSSLDFQANARLLGISSKSKVIIYDQSGVYSSPRAWFMFKSMGHAQVAILD